MTGKEQYDKESLKEFVCTVIDCLDGENFTIDGGGKFTIDGKFMWDSLDFKIKKVKEDER